MELKNMECVLNCGIKNGEQIVLAPSQHLITVTMHYGKEQIKTDVKPTATFLGLKNLLYTVDLDGFFHCRKLNKQLILTP